MERNWLSTSDSGEELAAPAPRFIRLICESVRPIWDGGLGAESFIGQGMDTVRVCDSRCDSSVGSGLVRLGTSEEGSKLLKL